MFATGQLQQTLPRLGKPPVNYEKGGNDYRCPHFESTTSMGKQVRARPIVFLAPSARGHGRGGSGSERARCSWGWGASVLASQVLAWPHTSSSGAMKFTVHPRFLAEKHRSPGPKFGSPSSIGKQPASGRPSLPAYGFGTSTRDGALKQYAVWSFR